jgi:transcriptional regulator
MYLPKHFEQHDAAELTRLMREHPLATLVTTAEGGALTADHVPLEYIADAGPHGTLRGHVARANPLWQHAAGNPVLVVFNGPQAYVSPSWYPSKQEHHKVVPTWNYAVVHATGVLRAIEEAPWLHGLVSGLTGSHEAARPAPWAVTDAPEAFVQQMLRAIVGIEIPIDSLVGKWKLSQNRSAADKAGTVSGLAVGDAQAQATARWMSAGPR